MITNLEYRNGKNNITCSLIQRIGDVALIRIKRENRCPLLLDVNFNLIAVTSKYRIQKNNN